MKRRQARKVIKGLLSMRRCPREPTLHAAVVRMGGITQKAVVEASPRVMAGHMRDVWLSTWGLSLGIDGRWRPWRRA